MTIPKVGLAVKNFNSPNGGTGTPPINNFSVEGVTQGRTTSQGLMLTIMATDQLVTPVVASVTVSGGPGGVVFGERVVLNWTGGGHFLLTTYWAPVPPGNGAFVYTIDVILTAAIGYVTASVVNYYDLNTPVFDAGGGFPYSSTGTPGVPLLSFTGVSTAGAESLLVGMAGQGFADDYISGPPVNAPDWISQDFVVAAQAGLVALAVQGVASNALSAALAGASVEPFRVPAWQPNGNNGLIVDCFYGFSPPLPPPPPPPPPPSPNSPPPAGPPPPPPSTTAGLAAGIQGASGTIVDSTGKATMPFYRFLTALWQRGGGGVGVSSTDLYNNQLTLTQNVTNLINESGDFLVSFFGSEGLEEGGGVDGTALLQQGLVGAGDQGALAPLQAILALGVQGAQGASPPSRALVPWLEAGFWGPQVPGLAPALLLASALAEARAPGPAASPMLLASETLAPGAMVNIWDNAGVANLRNANATDATKPVDGFTVFGAVAGTWADIWGSGNVIKNLAGLTPGAQYWLSTTGGQITLAAPATTGNWDQQVGKALSPTSLFFNPNTGVVV